MKVSEKTLEININSVLNISVDVSSKKLDVYFDFPLKLNRQRVFRDEIVNRSTEIASSLKTYLNLAHEAGFKNIRIVCEPTGPYSINLLSVAKSLNCLTAYVNPESVNKSKVIETNEIGKTDKIDTEVIHSLAIRNKVLIHRTYSRHYARLRTLNSHYEDNDRRYVSSRNHVSSTLVILFPDFSMGVDTLYSKTGLALYNHFRFNPWRITAIGFNEFLRIMRLHAKGIRKTTICKIWEDAQSTCQHNCDDIAYCNEDIFCDHYEDYILYNERRNRIRQQMINTLKELRKSDLKIPKSRKGFISEFHVARLIAETGPLSDFAHFRQLVNYIGMHLRERQSGLFKGQTKLSKKGRPPARKVLSQIVLPLLTKNSLYGPAYHEEKERTGKSGTKLMVKYMRKFLKSFYGLYKSNLEFDECRLFIDQGGYQKLSKSA